MLMCFQRIALCVFSLSPADSYTDRYTHRVKDRLRLMMAGEQTDTVLYGKACSHILTTPLKIYLPLLQIRENDVVVMDEKAGADGVTTGIVNRCGCRGYSV